jgi:phosphate transport system protein
MEKGHIVSAFDQELGGLTNVIMEMGGIAEAQLADAIQAVATRDIDLAEKVVAQDKRVDQLEAEVDAAAIQMLALRQPMAGDLRQVVTALKVSHMVERIADYAKNIARRATVLSQLPPIQPRQSIPRMGRLAQQQLKDVLDAYVKRDADRAIAVWQSDRELDELYEALFREVLTYMMEDPRNITAGTHVLFMAKNIERIGDHATNVAEMVYFLVHGEPLQQSRPKGDRTSLTVVEPQGGSATASEPE